MKHRFTGWEAFTIALSAIATAPGCNVEPSIEATDVRLVRTTPSKEPITYGMAPVQGIVNVVAGCLSLEKNDGDSVVLVYPHDYQLDTRNGSLRVVDAAGNSILTVGRYVETGGALLGDEPATRMVPAEDRHICKGPFFLVLPEHR